YLGQFMKNKPLKFMVFFLLFSCLSGLAVTIEQRLQEILKARPFDESAIKGKITHINFLSNNFSLENNGIFYKIDGDRKYSLEIFHDKNFPKKKIFLIFDPHTPQIAGLPTNPLSTSSATEAQVNIFDDIVSTQRLYGMYAIKSK